MSNAVDHAVDLSERYSDTQDNTILETCQFSSKPIMTGVIGPNSARESSQNLQYYSCERSNIQGKASQPKLVIMMNFPLDAIRSRTFKVKTTAEETAARIDLRLRKPPRRTVRMFAAPKTRYLPKRFAKVLGARAQMRRK